MKKKNDEENTVKEKPLLYSDHKTPVTRRDFLASGLLGMTTMALSSTTLALMSKNVFAQSACSAGPLMNGNVPFLCIDIAGGMNIAGGNAIIGQAPSGFQGEVGGVLSHFRRLGIPDEYHPSKTGMIDNTFGLKFHSSSGILQGMNEVLLPRAGDLKDLRKYVDGVIIGGVTNDDTQNNPLNTVYMAHKVGAKGDLVQLIGTKNSVSGGESFPPPDQIDLTKKPSPLGSFQASEGLLSIGQNIMDPSFLNPSGTGGSNRMKRFMELLGRSGSSQRNAISAKSTELEMEMNKYQERLNGTQSIFNTFAPDQLNPLKNATHRTVLEKTYGKTLATFTGGEVMSSNIVNLLTTRIAGAGTISVGGGDYHDGTARTGQNKDVEVGRYIGNAIRMASLRNVPLFIHVFTDGGVVGDAAGMVDPQLPNRTVWASDDGTRSAALMIVFKPARERSSPSGNDEYSNFLLTNKTRQIGYFKPGGGNALDAHSLSNNVSKLWKGIILNYMATMVNSNDDDQIRAVVKEQFVCRFGELPPDWEKLIRFRSLITLES
jgi:hypothetical protein